MIKGLILHDSRGQAWIVNLFYFDFYAFSFGWFTCPRCKETFFWFPSAAWNLFLMHMLVFWWQLQMDTLQSRLDAEFLLAHMCSVKFKEWIVVLATLLRRAEVLVDLFRHDLRLWKAYSITLQSHDVFREYLDLLNMLEEQLSSVSDLTLQNGPLSWMLNETGWKIHQMWHLALC